MKMSGAISLGLMVAFGGCEAGSGGQPGLTPAARVSPAAERAIEAMASARCNHEQRCNTIGPTGAYMTREHCLNVMRADGYDELGACEHGVDQEKLQECLAAIADQDCNGARDRLERLPACRAAELCLE